MTMQEIKFYLPGFTRNLDTNLALVESMRLHGECYHDRIRIASFFGSFPNAIWNGGRCEFGKVDIPMFEDIVYNVNALGIAIRYTFTNCLIKKEHLSDDYCNMLMSMCDNGMNEVLVNSPLLEKYLRKHYPDFRYILSTTTLTRGPEAVNEACRKYDLVVADYRDVRDKVFLAAIENKDKVEILLNEACVYDCVHRGRHYEDISRAQLLSRESAEVERRCIYNDTSRFREAYVPVDTLYEELVPSGFVNYKIRGREMAPDKLLKEYLNYMAKPDLSEVVMQDVSLLRQRPF